MTLTFWFVRHDEDEQPEGGSWASHLEAWLKLVPDGGRFATVQGMVVTLEDITARDYVESDPLDLDYLSAR